METISKLLGVDTGGTFTDLVLFINGQLYIHKVLSTPQAPEEAIIKGMQELGIASDETIDLVHGSTVATNAALEGKGAKTAYISNRGFGDVLTIGRQAREDIYDLTPPPVPPPVPPELCIETGGRISHTGEVLEDLTADDLAALRIQLQQLAPESVAINFLFSFINDKFEQAVVAALKTDGYFISHSSDVLMEQREYERGIATWLNSYVGPVMQRYLRKLSRRLPASNIRVMQSHGKTIRADKASHKAVNLLLSGPAAGVIAVQQIAALSGHRKALSFDMGGTSTDVAMIDDEVTLTSNGRINHYPVSVPMVDIHTIGAGGSSIIYTDSGGMLRVGPQSAGALPGPACYGLGGEQPTITDANLLLGRLPEKLGNHLRLDKAAAARAFAPLARQLNMEVYQLAAGAVDIVNEQMTQALHVMSAQKGHDPAGFLLVGFGAAGGLHICTLAENMRIDEAIIPPYAGVLSALGMLTAEQGLQKSQTVCKLLEPTNINDVERIFRHLLNQAEQEMTAQGIAVNDTCLTVDLRYQGQWHCLNCRWQPLETLAESFHRTHEKLYGYRLDALIELVTAKLQVTAPAPLQMATVLEYSTTETSTPQPSSADSAIPFFWRAKLADQIVHGPAIVAETVATTYIKDGWQAYLDQFGNLRLTRAHQSTVSSEPIL